MALGRFLSLASILRKSPFMLEQSTSLSPDFHSPVSTSGKIETTPIKVLHAVNGEHFPGAERVQSHLERCLPQFDVSADFTCVKLGKFASMVDEHSMVDEQQGNWGSGFRTSINH